jgi:cardiolipin synthase
MDDLLKVIAEFGIELHPDRVALIASKIETLGSVEQFGLIKSSFGPNTDKELVARLGQAWRNNSQSSPTDVAYALRGASATAIEAQKRGAVEMVWTGPTAGQVAVRHTEQVLCEVIDSAARRLFVVSFVAYRIEAIIRSLRQAVGRQVQIDVLLESSESNGGRVNHDSIKLMKNSLPSINTYIWVPERKGESSQVSGAVHAKCAVADGALAFITSANLTGHAMEHNMELGVLVRGGDLPRELHHHLESLIASGIIEKVDP